MFFSSSNSIIKYSTTYSVYGTGTYRGTDNGFIKNCTFNQLNSILGCHSLSFIEEFKKLTEFIEFLDFIEKFVIQFSLF